MPLLDFFTDGKAVGHFLTEYPLLPGRYRFEPYRGEGHAILALSLKAGTPVSCSFPAEGTDVIFTVVQELFIPAKAESYWFIDIARVEAPSGVHSVDRHPHRHALMPIERRGSDEAEA